MFYLKDSDGNTVRAIQWDSDEINFIQLKKTKRIETCIDLKKLDDDGIEYTLINAVHKDHFKKSRYHAVASLQLVQESDQILENISLPEDDAKKFKTLLQKTSVGAVLTVTLFAILSLFITPQEAKQELVVVQVMDRKQIEKSFVVPPSETKVSRLKKQVLKNHYVTPKQKNLAKTPTQAAGVLGVLGSLKKSNQRGGLQLDQADVSAGIGRGGKQGSGGVQTAVYSKGMFSAPLGVGGKVNGAGGYGTKGKGGGRAGYGQIQLVGAGQSYFQPIESEAFVGGGLDRDEIAAVIQRHLSEVRYCYEQGLQNKPRLAGRVSIQFLIGPQGRVTTANVDNSSLGHQVVEGCIRDRLKTWNFPQPEGGVTVKVNYPFILRRVSDT